MRHFYKVVDWILEIRVVQRIVFVMFRSWHKEGRGGAGGEVCWQRGLLAGL